MSYQSYQLQIDAEIELRNRFASGDKNLIPPDDWRDWLPDLFPKYVAAPFAQRHIDFWEWVDNINVGVRPSPFVGLWPRGGAKSSSAELASVRLGATEKRKYIWYVSGTQDKADSHVENIGGMLESGQIEKYYPSLASRAIGKYGNSKGWRRSRLKASNGFTVDALGLDTSARGMKDEEQRPDMIILDDVDELHDSFATTQKKIQTITKSILPSGSNGDCAVLFIQNLIHPDSIASMLADGRADFLADRIVSGPYPALNGLTYEIRYSAEHKRSMYFITGGVPTWQGQNIEICQSQIHLWGLSSFLQEAQHDVDRSGGIWDHIEFEHIERRNLPNFVRVVVWVDPAVTSTDKSDSMGISAGGVDENGKVYGLYFWEAITSPEDAMERAILKALELGASVVGVETDQGGDTWISVYMRACDKIRAEHPELSRHVFPAFDSEKAGAGNGSKVERNSRMLADYEHGNVVHMTGTHATIEKSLRRFPNKPLDLADSWFWTWFDLAGHHTPLPKNQPEHKSKWLGQEDEESNHGWTKRY
jgi:Uncharacterized conserved protein